MGLNPISGRGKMKMCSEVIQHTADEIRSSHREQRARKTQFFMAWRSELRIAMKKENISSSKMATLSGKNKSVVTRFFDGGDTKLSTLLAFSEALGMKWEVPKLKKIEDVFLERNKKTGLIALLIEHSDDIVQVNVNIVQIMTTKETFPYKSETEKMTKFMSREVPRYG